MFTEITYYLIFGKPFIMYLGLITLACFLATALIGREVIKGTGRIPFEWHKKMAILSIALAIVHAILGILAYF